MKNKVAFLFLLGALISFNTCKKSDPDPCENIDCVHGTCNNGTCDCDPGYELDANGKCTVISCNGVDCVNGTCDNGICDCDAGYELDANGKCTVVSRDKYIGSYQVEETCSSSGFYSYTATIATGTSSTSVKINNFWGFFINPVIATVDGNTLTIARQEPDNDQFFVVGTGTYSQNAGVTKVTFSYVVTDENGSPIESDICSSTVYTKQ